MYSCYLFPNPILLDYVIWLWRAHKQSRNHLVNKSIKMKAIAFDNLWPGMLVHEDLGNSFPSRVPDLIIQNRAWHTCTYLCTQGGQVIVLSPWWSSILFWSENDFETHYQRRSTPRILSSFILWFFDKFDNI